MKRVWLWIVAAAAAVAGAFLLVLTGRSRARGLPPLAPDRPDTPPVDKPLVVLRPADDYEAAKAQAAAEPSPPDAVVTRINDRHKS